jgi:hypothetical protein
VAERPEYAAPDGAKDSMNVVPTEMSLLWSLGNLRALVVDCDEPEMEEKTSRKSGANKLPTGAKKKPCGCRRRTARRETYFINSIWRARLMAVVRRRW